MKVQRRVVYIELEEVSVHIGQENIYGTPNIIERYWVHLY